MWLTRFLVVRTCGYLEQVTHEIARAYIAEKSGGMVRSFAISWMDTSRNPSPDNLLTLVGRFDANLADELRSIFVADDQRLSRELSLLVDRRHKIAHGLNEGLSTAKAIALMQDVEQVAEWFIKNLDPSRRKLASQSKIHK